MTRQHRRNATFHLTEDCIELIAELSRTWGITKSDVIEISTRMFHGGHREYWNIKQEKPEQEDDTE